MAEPEMRLQVVDVGGDLREGVTVHTVHITGVIVTMGN
jgi:hypothetical protein